MYGFDYSRPAALPAAVALLSGDGDAKPLAGGQSLIPVLKQRLAQPSRLVDLAGLGMSGIRDEGVRIVIGAMTPHAVTAADDAVRARFPGLAKLASWIGDRQVRHRGTIGGSLANNDPAACYPSAVLAAGATIVTDRRRIAAGDFFRGLYTTALEPDEIITAVEFPVPAISNYVKFRHPASRFAMAGVFVARGPAGIRVAITGAGSNGVFRHTAAEAALGTSWTAAALDGIKLSSEEMSADMHGSAAYRAHLADTLTRRAVEETMQAAGS